MLHNVTSDIHNTSGRFHRPGTLSETSGSRTIHRAAEAHGSSAQGHLATAIPNADGLDFPLRGSQPRFAQQHDLVSPHQHGTFEIVEAGTSRTSSTICAAGASSGSERMGRRGSNWRIISRQLRRGVAQRGSELYRRDQTTGAASGSLSTAIGGSGSRNERIRGFRAG